MNAWSFDRLTRQGARGAALLLIMAACGCASTIDTDVPRVPAPWSGDTHSWQRFQVERNGLSKKVRFRDLETSRTVTMKYKGFPVAWGSPINLLFDEDVYQRESHRVRYRFQHPLTSQPMVLVARAKSHYVANVQIRTEDTLPVVQLFTGDEKQPRGALRYDDGSRILFSGEIEERQIEIERVSADIPPDRELLKYFLFPFPVMGEFVIRVDGQEAARFAQQLQHGVTSPYDLALDEETDQATRDDAMLAFVVFDLMKDFVNSANG